MSSMNLQKNQQNQLLYIGFNQDNGCFACGTDKGFRIYNCDPFKETFLRTFNNGIGHVEMLFRCNILALVGGGSNPRYSRNKVILWDDHQNRCIGELSYRSEIRSVKLRRDRIVVVLNYKVYVYNFSDLKLVDTIDTLNNERSIVALSPKTENTVLAVPGTQVGHVRVELYDLKKTTHIAAHETALACIALSFDGTKLATASEKGTLIRVFDTRTGKLLHELRRGAEKVTIYSISFHPTNKWLAVSSAKGTVHIFKLDDENDPNSNRKTSNPTSSLSFMANLLPKYFASQWSFAQFKVPEVRNIVTFGEGHSIVVVCADGTFYKATFDPNKPGSECTQVAFVHFLKRPDEVSVDST